MPAFQINDDEWSALVEEPGDIFLAYCSIRRVMDYRTGVAGRSRRISEQMISEVLYVAPCRGRHESGSPTRQRVRSTVDRLVKLGVLVPVGPMVYELPLASRDGASKTSATDEQPDQQPYQQPTTNQPEPTDCGASGDLDTALATASESGETGNSNLPPVSGVNPTAHIAHACANDRFPMHDAWEPDRQSFHAVLFRNGMANVRFHPDQLLEFRSYWIARPDKQQTQAQWEHQLAQQLKRTIRIHENEGPRHEASGRAAAGRARNAFEILTDDNW